MKKAFGILLILLLLVSVKSAAGQGKDEKFSLNFELIYPTMLIGNNEHYGDIYSYSERRTSSQQSADISASLDPQAILKYGAVYSPLVTKMRTRPSFNGGVNYRLTGKIRISINGLYFKTSGSDGGRISSPDSDDNNYYANGVRMFGQSRIPVRNELEGGGALPFSPVNYGAGNKFSVFSVDLFAAEKASKHLEVILGFKILKPASIREEFQTQRAFIYDYYNSASPDSKDHFNNQVSMKLNSRADYGLLKGPLMGFRWGTEFKRFELAAMAKQSLVFGSERESGNWRDIDDVQRVSGPRGGPFTLVSRIQYLEGNFPTFLKQKVFIPVTELHFGANFRVTNGVRIGIGFTVLAMYDVATAPRIEIPGLWCSLCGTGWVSQRRNIFVGGLGTTFTFKR